MFGIMRRAIGCFSTSDGMGSDAADSKREAEGQGVAVKSDLHAIASGGVLVDAASIPALQRQQRLIDLYLFVVDWCLRNGASQWWKQAVALPFTDTSEGLEHLKTLCLTELLYAAGDVAAFCKVYEMLEEDGYLGGDERGQYILDLMRFARPRLDVEPLRSARSPLAKLFDFSHESPVRRGVISVVIPDDAAFSHFVDLCWPSLQSHDEIGRAHV
jgi:hypothetical protein